MSFEIPFSHIAEIIMGQSPKGEDVNNEGIGLPLLNGPTEFTDRYPVPVQHTAYAKKTSLPGDILFCVRGSTTGRMNYSDQKYCIGRGLAAIRGRNGYPTPYVKAVLETYLPKLLAAATGSTFPNVSKDLINNIPVSVLPVENACNISKLIELQEEKVFTNNQINQTLEQMAQSLFKSWFIDFEPVKAKIAVLEAGGSQADATLAAMTAISGKDDDALVVFEREHPEQYAELKATAELFPSAMQESELGAIPKGWGVENYRSFCDFVQSGGTPKRSEETYWDDGDIRWLSSGEVRDKIIFETKERITAIGLQNSTAKLWPKYSTVMAMYGATAGKICLLANEMSANQACCALYSRKYSFFIYFSMCNSASVIASKASGSAQQNLNKGIIENAVFCKPTENLIDIYNKSINGLILKWISNVKYNENLTQLRDTLLPKLLSGEITLPEAEQIISEEA
ncbi:restriction endonuclease subunit S [Salmonella enterica subsp. enterica serovar Corvallis]|uniref:Restriction endonuclease subunit S n=3 Tax=Salmonella enterica TaxID=28901 RepID=A0A5V1GWG9_SALER|nr:restriction endonuclease subunit S [Salmonella enterica]ECU9078158.1 restriction endonuclease subunit S [Salmonella enterica subsp. enterica serovar O rough]ECZ3650420.1 restriction endonuclease subunit S [Salmonella enterica subsp. enterica serovar Chailey]EDQ4688039.1 restriction endonuclease subunit S [Salmonella enterica subsp. enterica serovar Stanleyville]MBJ5311940.1 restriction endonuclease subunit S [Salmonella enterica subsp. enterica serovar Dabou]AWD07851.1 restriction endonucle